MRRLFTAFVILVSALISNSAATARSYAQSSDTISKELVALLLRGPGMNPGDNFDIKIGAPADFPRELLPDGATAAVSTVSERATTVVAEAPALGDDLGAYQSKVEAAGWISHGPMSMRGLVSNATPPPLMFCQKDRYATVYLSPRAKGGRFARISLTTDPRRGTCQAGPRYGGPSFFADVTLPLLLPPPDSRATGAGGGGSSDSWEQRLRLQTKLDAAAIAAHYASQLQKAGWKLESRAGAEGIAVVRLSTVSTIKEPIVGVVAVTPLPGGAETDVTLRLLRVDPNRRFPGPGMVGTSLTIGSACCW